MRQQMHDTIAISDTVGHPEFFVTITCHQAWPEITRELLVNQNAQDRLDLGARVFHMKLRKMMLWILDEGIFGKVVAHVQAIDFQKRSLPHTRCIFFFDKKLKGKPNVPEYIDTL